MEKTELRQKKKKTDDKGIFIKGAKVHNLKNIDVFFPRNKFIVVTGVSGSGKSSLTIDTLYAEGQRRYVESLSSYARQFLMRMDKPDVDYIKGICPAIAIEQKVSTRNTRSTVGTLTEIYDYLRLLYSRIGKTISPVSGKEVKKDDTEDVMKTLERYPDGTKVQLLVPFRKIHHRTLKKELEILLQKGYTRVIEAGELKKVEDLIKNIKSVDESKLEILIDRFKVKKDDQKNISRISDSVESSFFEGEGECTLEIFIENKKIRESFSSRFEQDNIIFEEPTPHLFSFNNPFGACPECEGFGSVIGIDEDLVIPDKTRSVYDDAIVPWRGEKMKKWKERLLRHAHKFDFPIHRDYRYLTNEEKLLLWTGNEYFKGLNEFFDYLERKLYKIQYRVMLSRYRGRTVCPECKGTRLRKEAAYVRINDKSITDLVNLPVKYLVEFFNQLDLPAHDEKIARRILIELISRLEFMMLVGLNYLTLNRISGTLSGGETQRINLTRMLGSNLTQSLYLLDEPSIGLHPRDIQRLTHILKKLRDMGNTVVVVEHEEEMIRAADHIIDMGPLAGRNGGEVIFEGNFDQLLGSSDSLTAQYFNKTLEVPVPEYRRKAVNFLQIEGARQHNLQDIDVKIPLNALSVVTGVSGSGKTTLIKQIFYPALQKELNVEGDKPGDFDNLTGDLDRVGQIELVDQNPIGKSSRSNPVTYIKAYDSIRQLFANQHLSKMRGFKPKHFSFNVEGGRCESCKGEGEIVVEMQFLADIHLTCEECGGKRFKEDVLEVKYQDKNIADVLEMTVDEAIEFFKLKKDVVNKLQPLQNVGLGYVQLGQSSGTLSGGEAQRVKLASFLSKGKGSKPVLFIFDEPTTGLHFNDINKLLTAINALIEKGHTVVIIEHNMEVIKSADWLIDLGPEGGDEGGELLYEGPPEGLTAVKESYTGEFLKDFLG